MRRGGAYALLEVEEVVLGESVGLGNDRDEVDAGTETLHHFDIEGLEAARIVNWHIQDSK